MLGCIFRILKLYTSLKVSGIAKKPHAYEGLLKAYEVSAHSFAAYVPQDVHNRHLQVNEI
jgi:hypothetical protein